MRAHLFLPGRPLLFASAAIFMDTYKATEELARLVADTTTQFLIRFVVLGLVGVGVVAAGVAYNKYKVEIASRVETLKARVCTPCRQRADAGNGGAPAPPPPEAVEL